MAVDFGVLIRADVSEIGADTIAEIESKLYAVIQGFTVTTTHNATYSASGADNLTITLSAGGAVTVDWAFRIEANGTGVSLKRKVEIIRKLVAAVSPYTVHAIASASYSAGTPNYQVEAVLSG